MMTTTAGQLTVNGTLSVSGSAALPATVTVGGTPLTTLIGNAGGVVTTNVGTGSIRESPQFTSTSGVAANFNTTYGWASSAGWAITASSEYDSTYIMQRAFDKGNNEWITANNSYNASTGYSNGIPQWIAMKFPEQVYMRSFSIQNRNTTTALGSPREFSIQGSDDGSNWTTLKSYSDQTGWTQAQVRTFGEIPSTFPPYSNIRLLIDRGTTPETYVAIGELRLFTQATNTTTTAGQLTVNGNLTVSGGNITLLPTDSTLTTKVAIGNNVQSAIPAKLWVDLSSDNVQESGIIIRRTTATTGVRMMSFYRSGNTEVGSITTSSTSTSYNTASDYRLKNVLGSITNASQRLLALKPIRFSWKSTGGEVDGFLAHELQEVVPDATCGIKDATDEEGNPTYQGIDQSKLVPLLVASLQDALKRIAILESR